MSSIRLFILSSFAELGPMHGHRLRLEAERKHMPLWTDIPVGAVYGAMKRLAAENLLREVAREQQGNRPTRQVYEITDAGRDALAQLRRTGLEEIWFRYDPFDLALTRCDPATLDMLPQTLRVRLERVQSMLTASSHTLVTATPHISLAEEWALRHSEHRLKAEVEFLRALVDAAPNIVADERRPRPKKPKNEPRASVNRNPAQPDETGS